MYIYIYILYIYIYIYLRSVQRKLSRLEKNLLRFRSAQLLIASFSNAFLSSLNPSSCCFHHFAFRRVTTTVLLLY